MNNRTIINGKAWIVGLVMFANAISATAQETVEIRYTKDGVFHTVEVERDIEVLSLSDNDLASFALPEGLMNLELLDLSNNDLTSLTLPNGLKSLEDLYLSYNQLTNLTLPEGLTNLRRLYLNSNLRFPGIGVNQLQSLTLPNGLTNLEELDLTDSGLTSLTLPEGLTNLKELNLTFNQLTNFTLPKGLTSLEVLSLYGNELTSLTLPEGLKNLWALNLSYNQLTSLRLAEDTAERFAGIDAERALAYNLTVHCSNVPLRKVILPKRLDGKISFFKMEDDVYDNLEFLFLEDLRSPKITRAGDALEITWAVGVLQTSAGIEGPWKDIRASSPLRIFPRPSLPAEFFRVRAE